MEYPATNMEEEDWDLVIRPASGFLHLGLKEVWHYRDLLWLFVRRDFAAQYKQTILGPLWHIIQPLFTSLMFLLVFYRIANIPTDHIQPPLLFYMAGITIWNYFSSCVTSTSGTFIANAGIFGKVYFPRLVLPLSIVLSNLVRFGIQFFLLLLFMIWYAWQGYPIAFSWNWLLIPVLLVIMAGTALGLGIVISSVTTKYRDLTVLIGFAMQLAMYATPVVYPLSYIKGKNYAWIIYLNPVTPVVETFRYALFSAGSFSLVALGYAAGFMVVVLLAGVAVFNKVEKTFMDTV